MEDLEIRTVLVHALERASTRGFRDPTLSRRFLQGDDIALESLELDSMGRMELCIAIEETTGVVLVPDDLETLRTMNAIVEAIIRGES
jgi:hypothetical protein